MNNYIIKLRHIRILGMSSFELLLTIIGVVVFVILTAIFKETNWKQIITLSFVYLIAIFIIGIIAHYIFNIHTQLNYWLGLSECPPDLDSLSGMFEC